MIIQHNMTAYNTNRQLGITNGNLAKSSEKLSSGYRINRAGDDAAGLSISEKMRGQIRGLEQASTNAQDGISLIQVAEGAMNEIHAILQRQRELTVQAANDTNVEKDRIAIEKEMNQLNEEIDRIANSTEFNTMKLLDGTGAEGDGDIGKFTFQVGANTNEDDVTIGQQTGAQSIELYINKMTVEGLGLDGESFAGVADIAAGDDEATPVKFDTFANANAYLDTIDAAMELVSNTRSDLGAKQNRLEHTIANADNTAENLQAAESRIRDIDMAEEMVKYSKDSILQQAAQSMLAQANQASQGVLSLLQ